MRKILDKIKTLQINLARASTAKSGRTHYSRWKKNASETPVWDKRNLILAKHIPPSVRVLDLGAGAQTLRKHLPNCDYVPCDLVQSTPDCIVCDFNAGLYPKVDRPFDVVICSGVIEYLREPLAFLKRIQTFGPIILISYQPFKADQEKMNRVNSGFLNHFRREEIEGLFVTAGYQFGEVDRWENQVIYRLSR
jgi:hypothetical protein